MDSQSLNYDQAEKLAAEWISAQPTVATFVFSLVKDYHVTEEILSRIAVVLVRKYDTYDPKLSFISWAMGIAKYEILNSQRLYARDRHQFSGGLIEKMSEFCETSSDEADPRMLYLEECLKRIRGRARRTLTLRYTAGMKPAQIAKLLQISGGAVRVLLSRTRNALRSCIERRLIEEGGNRES